MRIAVIGSGISGLTAALVASDAADVTLFESDSRLGGHANTVFVGPAKIPVDTGFMVFNPPRYPAFTALLEYLEIPSTPTTMSFSVSIPGIIEYSSVLPWGMFADWRNLFRPSHYRFIRDIRRFNAAGLKTLESGLDESCSLATFLIDNHLTGNIIEWYLHPMLGAIWSCPTTDVDAFPALATLRFLDNHGLLDPFSKTTWRTIPGGSIRYVTAIEERLRARGVRILSGTAITHIERSATQVTVHTDNIHEVYDHLVLATHADTALSLLAKPSEAERSILGAFTYSRNTAVLHNYRGCMPERHAAWASWNYHARSRDTLSLTYNMNSLQHIDQSTPVYVTLNPTMEIPASQTYARIEYSHPLFDGAALRAQKRLGEIQNTNRTSFTGAHWGYGFHEDGIQSAIDALSTLGISPPWQR